MRYCGCVGGFCLLCLPFFDSPNFFSSRKDHEKAEFEVHEVYAVDVLVSSGEGKVSPALLGLLFLCACDSQQQQVVLTATSLWVPVPAKEYVLPGYRCVFLGGAFSIQKVEVHLDSVGVRMVLVRCKRPSACRQLADLAEEVLPCSWSLSAVCIFRQRMLDRELQFTKGTPPNSMA